jgi:hypothetical protein
MAEAARTIIWFLFLPLVAAGLGYVMGMLARQYSDNNVGGRHKRTFAVAAANTALVLCVISLGAGWPWALAFILAWAGAFVAFTGGVFAWSGPAWTIAKRIFIVSFPAVSLISFLTHPRTLEFFAGLPLGPGGSIP